MTAPQVVAVGLHPDHRFSKIEQHAVSLLKGLGVEGDAHAGVTVQHRSRVAQNPDQPNLRQVHLIHEELLDELNAQGFAVRAGQLGENITTRGIALLDLPVGSELHLGESAVVRLTGLRNPCGQLDAHQDGLLAAVLDRKPDGSLVQKAGVMGVVVVGGVVKSGDAIALQLPPTPHRPLERV